jgi:cold-inducible RNA-binding protein
MRIFVGNLTMPVTEDDLRQLFEPYGEVAFVQIIADQTSGEGQGFVLMPDDPKAQAAMDALQGTQLQGRTLTIHAAHWQW